MKNKIIALLAGLALVAYIPAMSFAARTAAPNLTGLFPSSTLSVNLPTPSNFSIGLSTTTGSVFSNGGNALYFEVVALDGAGGLSGATTLIGTSTVDQAHGWQLTWNAVQGATGYRVYFSTSTPQTVTQYFTATSTNNAPNTYYTFTSTSSPTFVASPPSSVTGYVVNLNSVGNSWMTGGMFAIGSSTPQVGQVSISTSTAPQLSFYDMKNVTGWSFRSVANTFYISTSSPTATSSNPVLSIDASGATPKISAFSTNTATSSFSVGCFSGYATSTATPVKLALTVSSVSTTTFSGTANGGTVVWMYGTCP